MQGLIRVVRIAGLLALPGIVILVGVIGQNPFVWAAGAVGYFVAAHYIARAAGLGGLSGIGLNRHAGWGRGLLIGFLLGSLFQVGRVLLLWRFGGLEIAGMGSLLNPLAWEPLLVALYIGFAEEILGRGYFFGIVPARWSMQWVALLSAVWFTVLHVNDWTSPPARWAEIFLLGLALAAAYGGTRSLWLAGGMHWGIDFWHRFLGADGTTGGKAYWLVTNRTPAFEQLWQPIDLILSTVLLLIVVALLKYMPKNLATREMPTEDQQLAG